MKSNTVCAKGRKVGDRQPILRDCGLGSSQGSASGAEAAGLPKRHELLPRRADCGARMRREALPSLGRIFVLLGILLMTASPSSLAGQTAVNVPMQLTLGSGLNYPSGVAVDAAGNVFVADENNNRVLKLPAGGGPQTTVFNVDNDAVAGIAVDTVGDLYVAESKAGYVVKVSADGSPETRLGTGLVSAYTVAVDGAGDVFIVDNESSHVVEVPAGGGPQITLPITGLNDPQGVAVDAKGDVLVADPYNQRVVKLPAGGGAQTTVGTGWVFPFALSVDPSGDLFVTDVGGGSATGKVIEVPANGGAQTTIASALGVPQGVAADGQGDVYISNTGSNSVLKIETRGVNFGPVNVCPVGHATPAPCSETLTMKYNVTLPQGVSVGNVFTLGSAPLDFNVAAPTSTTCGVVTSGTSCTVAVTFSPKRPGLREGAVLIVGSDGNLLATTFLRGTGLGPEIAFTSSAETLVGSGLKQPAAVAMDGQGDVYIADAGNGRLVVIPAGGGTPVIQNTGGFPTGIAVDGAGDLFVSDFYGGDVQELTLYGQESTPASGLKNPVAIAIDGAGDAFIADSGNNRVLEVPAGGMPSSTVGTGLLSPEGVAVDAAGDVFIADGGNDRVVEVSTVNGAQSSIGSGLSNPAGVAVDAAGDVFITDTGNNRLVEVPAGGGPQIVLLSSLNYPTGIYVDASGDILVADTNNNRVVELKRSTIPALSFAATQVATVSTDSPQTVAAQNVGNQPLDLTNVSYPIDFPVDFDADGSEDLCVGQLNMAPGQLCYMPVDFTPLHAGSLSESLVLTDNSLNAAGAKQSITLSGTATTSGGPAPLTSPAQGSTLPGPTVTFAWTAASSATGYYLYIGSTGVGSSNLYKSSELKVTTHTSTTMPTNGETIYVRLITNYNGTEVHNDYTFTAARQGAITTPKPGSKFTAASVTFDWSAGVGATGYYIQISSKGVGKDDLYNSAETTATTLTFTKMPTTGKKIYVRLITSFNGVLAHTDYTFTAK